MKIIITGICGFAGSVIATGIRDVRPDWTVMGLDNLSRQGSEVNSSLLKQRGITVIRGDIRNVADVAELPLADWVIDTAANPSVLSGIDGRGGSRQVIEHNLYGTVNMLEYCKRQKAGFILLSTSRVYSINALAKIELIVKDKAFEPKHNSLSDGFSASGVDESFPTVPPLSLYGTTKISSEMLALEYHHAFGVPVWINRCGVLAGAGQFGRWDQGIFSFWIHSYCHKRPLSYIGFGGLGYQVRDCVHPLDLVHLFIDQIESSNQAQMRVINVSGGVGSRISLAQLSQWCAKRFGEHTIRSDLDSRRFDVPWLVLDSTLAATEWNWHPRLELESILEEIARHAEKHPEWLELCGC